VTAALADPPRPAGIHERAVAATLTCIERHGIAKTTLDDIAREAGCSRATLYRYFGGRSELVTDAVHAEANRVIALVRAAAETADSLEEAVVAMLLTAGVEIGEHPALRFVADFEPEILLPHLTFGGGDRFLATASVALAPSLERFLLNRAQRAAEWIARVGLTLWLSSTRPFVLTDHAGVRAYVREFVLPAIDPSTQPALPTHAKG
jgi:AcrR family transcriptional regulator